MSVDTEEKPREEFSRRMKHPGLTSPERWLLGGGAVASLVSFVAKLLTVGHP